MWKGDAYVADGPEFSTINRDADVPLHQARCGPSLGVRDTFTTSRTTCRVVPAALQSARKSLRPGAQTPECNPSDRRRARARRRGRGDGPALFLTSRAPGGLPGAAALPRLDANSEPVPAAVHPRGARHHTSLA